MVVFNHPLPFSILFVLGGGCQIWYLLLVFFWGGVFWLVLVDLALLSCFQRIRRILKPPVLVVGQSLVRVDSEYPCLVQGLSYSLSKIRIT